MHRFIAAAVLLFWAIMFGGLAHVSLSGLLDQQPMHSAGFQLLHATTNGVQLMPVLMMVVAALFSWALLALIVSDQEAFREVETYSYASAIFIMCVCALFAFVNLSVAVWLPAILTASLAVSVAASGFLQLDRAPQAETYYGRDIAKHMALSAAHNSLLSRVSGRPILLPQQARNNVTFFPTKPSNGDKS